MSPKISVLMPNYNCEKYLSEAIESILSQSFTDFEFIIIDDGSTDKSWEIIQEYAKKDKRIVGIKNEENLKICKTLNKGLEIAKGEYIARMDSDDISMPDRLKKQVAFLNFHPEVGIVGGTMDIMDENGVTFSKREYNLTDTEIRAKIFRYSPFCHATTMFRKRVIYEAGGYSIFLHDAEDYDLYFRLGMFGKFANLKQTLYKMRVNRKGITYTHINRMEKLTLYIRSKAVYEYGYKMTLGDKVYNTLQKVSMYIMPGRIKIWLFNLIRNS